MGELRALQPEIEAGFREAATPPGVERLTCALDDEERLDAARVLLLPRLPEGMREEALGPGRAGIGQLRAELFRIGARARWYRLHRDSAAQESRAALRDPFVVTALAYRAALVVAVIALALIVTRRRRRWMDAAWPLMAVGRFALAVGLLVAAVEAAAGRGYLYNAALRAASLGALLPGWVLIRWWRGDISDAYLRRHDEGTLAGAVRKTRVRWYGFFVAVVALLALVLARVGRAARPRRARLRREPALRRDERWRGPAAAANRLMAAASPPRRCPEPPRRCPEPPRRCPEPPRRCPEPPRRCPEPLQRCPEPLRAAAWRPRPPGAPSVWSPFRLEPWGAPRV
ncbi:hypothetical protein WMF38_05700 [Sorangium sp. So ce118]